MNENVFLFNPQNAGYSGGRFYSNAQNSQRMFLIFSVIWIAQIIFNLLLVSFDLNRLNSSGLAPDSRMETEAVLVSCSNTTPIFNIMNIGYTYTVVHADGSSTVYRGFDDVNGVCRSDTDAAPIQIYYSADDPSESRAVDGNAGLRLGVILRSVLIGFYVLALIGTAASYLNTKRRIKRLETEGQIVQGKIVSYGKRISWLPQGWVTGHYQFTNEAGQLLKGSSPVVFKQLEGNPLPPVGTPVAVVYADDRNFQAL